MPNDFRSIIGALFGDKRASGSFTAALPPPCGCKQTCCDVAEVDDHPRAMCKLLPVDRDREADRV